MYTFFLAEPVYISTGKLGRLRIALRMEGRSLTKCITVKDWHFIYSLHNDLRTGLHKSLAPVRLSEYILHGSAKDLRILGLKLTSCRHSDA